MVGTEISEVFTCCDPAGEDSDYTSIAVVRREVQGGAFRRYFDWLLGRPPFTGRFIVERIDYIEGRFPRLRGIYEGDCEEDN